MYHQQKHRRKSAEQKPGLSCATRQAKVYNRVENTNSIIRPQASVDWDYMYYVNFKCIRKYKIE